MRLAQPSAKPGRGCHPTTAAAEAHDALRAVRDEDRLDWRRVRMSLLTCSRDISCSALPSTVSSLPNCEESRKNVPTATSEASRSSSISPPRTRGVSR